jgi:hypothetical protein
VDEFMGRHQNVKLYGLSFKQVCQRIGYTPSHRVGELLKKFFWKKYTEIKKTETNEIKTKGTKLVFTPSCLISLPSTAMFSKEPKFSSDPEVVYDRERVVGFTEEEARIWLEVYRLRHGDRWVKYLVNTFELDKLPQFKNLVSSLPEQQLLFPEKPEKPEKDPEEPEEPEEDPDFDF